jgi:hypothetical protein
VSCCCDPSLAEAGQGEQAVQRGVRLAPLLSSPARARLCADTLIGFAPSEVKDVIRIVVSELTTNVVNLGPGNEQHAQPGVPVAEMV